MKIKFQKFKNMWKMSQKTYNNHKNKLKKNIQKLGISLNKNNMNMLLNIQYPQVK